MAPKPPRELWDIDQLADYLGVGRRFVYRLTSEKRIKYWRLGRSLRFDPSDVADYLEREAIRPDDDPYTPPATHDGGEHNPQLSLLDQNDVDDE